MFSISPAGQTISNEDEDTKDLAQDSTRGVRQSYGTHSHSPILMNHLCLSASLLNLFSSSGSSSVSARYMARRRRSFSSRSSCSIWNCISSRSSSSRLQLRIGTLVSKEEKRQRNELFNLKLHLLQVVQLRAAIENRYTGQRRRTATKERNPDSLGSYSNWVPPSATGAAYS
jgi:hypothetical protein